MPAHCRYRHIRSHHRHHCWRYRRSRRNKQITILTCLFFYCIPGIPMHGTVTTPRQVEEHPHSLRVRSGVRRVRTRTYLREEIESSQRLELVTPFALPALLRFSHEPSYVACLGVDIARDIDGGERPKLEKLLQERCVAAFARRLTSVR